MSEALEPWEPWVNARPGLTRVPDKVGRWGPGPWGGEPDLLVGNDPATGLPCLAIRNARSGSWCGYVGVSRDHPLYGVPTGGVDLVAHHHPVNYAGRLPQAAEYDQPPGTWWWFGFHCGHSADIQPGVDARDVASGYGLIRMGHEVYRTLAYVQAECVKLADQLSKVGRGKPWKPADLVLRRQRG